MVRGIGIDPLDTGLHEIGIPLWQHMVLPCGRDGLGVRHGGGLRCTIRIIPLIAKCTECEHEAIGRDHLQHATCTAFEPRLTGHRAGLIAAAVFVIQHGDDHIAGGGPLLQHGGFGVGCHGDGHQCVCRSERLS